ncbi:hypothetical protein Nepgr_009993 [Nepenthes gracilis]|uniref:Mitochondrial glycoprotein n=1 Tax=Nepenthes gracilis TaxID=150966 RepID=A0AAD3SBJ9_NEPGR|nr:hypothetical protein Nepgr_009993 [Nepenthes gracilis]
MPRATTVLRKCSEAIKDSALLKVLRSEINHELSSNQFENHQRGSLGDFTLDWDAPHSQDVVLRKKCESGEEVAVSALLGPKSLEGSGFPRDVVMKVCIKKPGLCSVLLFDCGVWSRSYRSSDFKISTAYYLPSSVSFDHSDYRGPLFSTLDPDLQVALKVYLEARGIGEDLMNFLLLHLHRKELQQYVNWLHKIEKMVSGGE